MHNQLLAIWIAPFNKLVILTAVAQYREITIVMFWFITISHHNLSSQKRPHCPKRLWWKFVMFQNLSSKFLLLYIIFYCDEMLWCFKISLHFFLVLMYLIIFVMEICDVWKYRFTFFWVLMYLIIFVMKNCDVSKYRFTFFWVLMYLIIFVMKICDVWKYRFTFFEFLCILLFLWWKFVMFQNLSSKFLLL